MFYFILPTLGLRRTTCLWYIYWFCNIIVLFCFAIRFQREFPGAKYIAMDTMCKYWPWLTKIDPDLATQHKPFMSVMHAKANKWKCQVKVVQSIGNIFSKFN